MDKNGRHGWWVFSSEPMKNQVCAAGVQRIFMPAAIRRQVYFLGRRQHDQVGI